MSIVTAAPAQEDRLDSDLAQYAMNHPGFRARLEACAREIRDQTGRAPNEATVASIFEQIVGNELSRIGLRYFPEREGAVEGTRGRLRGRIDSRVGDLILEYKQASTLATAKDMEKATSQVLDYAATLNKQSGNTILAYVTDGQKVQRVEVSGAGHQSIGTYHQLDAEFLHEFMAASISTRLRALTASNLVDSFCGPQNKTRELSRALFNELANGTASDKTEMLFAEWQVLFKLAHDDTSKQQAIADRRASLSEAIGVPIADGDLVAQYRALFALQTAYSIIIKCLAVNVVHGIRKTTQYSTFGELSSASRVTSQRFLKSIENGDVFRNRGIENLLEGDFFSWYSYEDQFSLPVYEAIRPIFSEIALYESLSFFHGDTHAAEDLFKELYMRMIPEKVRHSLGEFYTPPWLADHTIRTAISSLEPAKQGNWRALDPTCGSGTFLTAAMQIVLADTAGADREERLCQILERVVGIDLNPLAVLTARINYFINISPLLDDVTPIEIPVYLGDASKMLTPILVDDIECVSHVIETYRGPINVVLPKAALDDRHAFSATMRRVESYARDEDAEGIVNELRELIPQRMRTKDITMYLEAFASGLVELEEQGWNGIWARIVSDYLVTSVLGEFDLVVGNPPWIDWKNLPQNYRASLVEMCVERRLFSGDGITGGINLNICALISVTVASNWLGSNGAMALLMPDTLLYQRSYEGYRKLILDSNRRIYLSRLVDWTKAGHPFAPVQQKFFTYLFTHKRPDSFPGVPVDRVQKRPGRNRPNSVAMLASAVYRDVEEHFSTESAWAEPVHDGQTYYTIANTPDEVQEMGKIAGLSPYRGREGIEFYPQELFLLSFVADDSPGLGLFENYQGRGSKHKISKFSRPLETEFMRPLVKGTMVSRYHVTQPHLYVPFYYEKEIGDGRVAVSRVELRRRSPMLYEFLQDNKAVLGVQTNHNTKIMGKTNTEFYSIARVGAYSHADNYVVYRDNTSWGAAVVSKMDVPWGGQRVPVFQNHAVTICERPDGSFISAQEAHYICAVLNSTLVTRFVLSSADSRSFRVRVPVNIPLFDSGNDVHTELADASVNAHASWDSDTDIQAIDRDVDRLMGMLFGLSS